MLRYSVAYMVLFSILFLANTTFAAQLKNPIPQSSEMPTGKQTFPPMGYALFCQKQPDACDNRSDDRSGYSGFIKMSKRNWRILNRINRKVNRSIISRSDEKIHGKPDVWSIQGIYGDCEDYVLRKQLILVRLGFPLGALRITTARDHRSRLHAVLLVKTDRGDFVLDNLISGIRPWKKVPYVWIKQQGHVNPLRWKTLSGYRQHVFRLTSNQLKYNIKARSYSKVSLKGAY